MWEFAIFIDKNKKEVAKNIYRKIKSFSCCFDNIVSYYENKDEVCVACACNDLEVFRYKSFLEELLIKVFCDIYKKRFLIENLAVKGLDDISNEAFLQAMLYFDRETDRYLVSKYLKLEHQMNLDGFFNFKLKVLKEKWYELVEIANENQIYLYSDDTFMELIKFLIDNIEYKSDVVNIVEQNNKYVITDSEFEEIDTLEEYENNDKNLISSLISLSPKNINIYCSDMLSNRVTKLICCLFEKRVRFLTKVN